MLLWRPFRVCSVLLKMFTLETPLWVEAMLKYSNAVCQDDDEGGSTVVGFHCGGIVFASLVHS